VIWVGHGYLRRETYRQCRNPFCSAAQASTFKWRSRRQSSVAMEALAMRPLEDRADSETWISTCGCARWSAGIGCLSSSGATAGPVEVRGNQTDHRPRDAPVGRRARPLVRCVLALSWTSRDVFSITMQDQALPHHLLFEQGLLHGYGDDWHSAARMLQRSRRRTASAKNGQRRQPFCQGQAGMLAFTTCPGVDGAGH